MLSSPSSPRSILVVVLWIFFVGGLTLAVALAIMWKQAKSGPAHAKAARLTDEEQAELVETAGELRTMQDLSKVMKRQLELIGMLKEAKEARKAAKHDDRLPELIDGFDRVDAGIREEHAKLSASLEQLDKMRGQGLDRHLDNALKTNSKVKELLKMQQEIAKEDRTWVEAGQPLR